MSYSLYLIGSRARGDNNINSDIDYVCIYDDVKPTLDLRGGSVSYYSVSRMEWMINNSKLFVKHLIEEGRPIIKQKTHHHLLNSFHIDLKILRQDYKEFIQSICSLTWIPSGTSGLRWGCDYIYTISRNVIYISNAFDGFFKFGYVDAVSYFLRKHEREDLLAGFLQLREEKYKYRSFDAEPSDFNVTTLNAILSMLGNKSICLAIGGISKIPCNKKISYEVLRLLERAIINGEVDDSGILKNFKITVNISLHCVNVLSHCAKN